MEKNYKELKNIHLNSPRVILQKVPNRKTAGHDGTYGFEFEKFLSIHDRLGLEINTFLEKRKIPV